jgi:hypothetical protein
MATIFASDPADFGRQLSQRAALQAQLNSRAADNSARFAFEAQRMRQEQANRNAAMMAAAAQQAADRRFSVAATDRNQRFALAQQDMAAKRAAADREARFKFEAGQGDLNRQAQKEQAILREGSADAREQRMTNSANFSQARTQAYSGTLAGVSDLDLGGLTRLYIAQFSLSPDVASSLASVHAQNAERNYRAAQNEIEKKREAYLNTALQEDVSEEQAIAAAMRAFPDVPKPRFLTGAQQGRVGSGAPSGAFDRFRQVQAQYDSPAL